MNNTDEFGSFWFEQSLEINQHLLYHSFMQVKQTDFNHYDYIFGMDEDNISSLKAKAPKNSTARILLLGDFDPEGERIIRDPYYVSVLIN